MTHVFVPLVNPNESDCLLAQLFVKDRQEVKKGDVLAVFETTKSTLELVAETDGFVIGLTVHEGDTLTAGNLMCAIAEDANAEIPAGKKPVSAVEPQAGGLPDGLRITQPALRLAQQHKMDLASLPREQLITEAFIQARIAPVKVAGDPNALIIYGGGGHAKSLIDLIRAEGKYTIAGILDDGIAPGSKVMDVPVLGGGFLLNEIRMKGITKAINAVGGIGNIAPRLAVYRKLKDAGFSCPTVIHPRAYLEPDTIVGEGGQIFFNAYIGSEVQVGFGCIINTGAIISHDCVLGDYVNISPGAILAGAVTVNERSLVGMGVTINLHVTVGAGSRIGNSAVVKADVPDNGIVRAGAIWPAEAA
jgi:sugar O-acyltransferase (sialic acid O-acetyltransferase NeuD family)